MRRLFQRIFGQKPQYPATSLGETPGSASEPSTVATPLAPLVNATRTSAATPSPLQPTALPMRSIASLPVATGPNPELPFDTKTMQRRQRDDRAAHGGDLWGTAQPQRAANSDITKLRRIGLPLFYSEHDLADWLGISLSRLRWYTHDLPADTTWHYKRIVMAKRSGGERVILAPKRELKLLQRKVLEGIVGMVPTAPAAHGFVTGRSTVTNAQPHVSKNVILKLDLKDFFPSITFPRVRGLFISLGYSFAVASALALLCTEYDREPFMYEDQQVYVSIGPRHLVQGAPTSPGLANLIAWRLDRRLEGLAAKRGFAYTRYADDLTFSGNDDTALVTLRTISQRIIHEEHFTPNIKKTRIARNSARQIVTGLVVNESVSVPRQTRRRMRAILHNASKTDLATQNRDARPGFGAYLRGMIAYINAANPKHAATLRTELDRIDPIS